MKSFHAAFSPLLGALAGAGMLKALLTILTMTGVLSAESGTYFYSIRCWKRCLLLLTDLFLGITLATKLGANPYVGGTIGAALLEPNFTSLLAAAKSTDFIGIPVILMDYSSSVFPVFISVSIYAVFRKSSLRK
ncbi:hypothetical protein GCM10020331_065250 [Ectobacillus funiculus]